MNKKCFVIFLFCALLLTGCAGISTETQETHSSENESNEIVEDTTDQTESEDSWVISKIKNDNPELIPRVTSIWDADDAELIYEDEVYQYYLEYTSSQFITVLYENGTKENLKDAMSSGRVDISDLAKANIGCFVVDKRLAEGDIPQFINLVHTDVGGDSAVQKFYEDDMFKYYFGARIMNTIFAYYTDGTRETVDKALEAGRIEIKDLDKYKISYYTRPNIIDVVDLTKTTDVECVQQKEYIYEWELYRYYFECQKSTYIELHYQGGLIETLQEAIENGHLSYEHILDVLSEFEIEYKSEQKS